MKVVVGALAASLFLGLAAWAQTAEVAPSRCQALPADPTIPDGATVSDRGIVSANETYMTWARALRANAECRRAEFDEVAAQRRAKAQAHDALNAQLREVSERWAAERNEYCARPRRQCREIPQSEIALPEGAAASGACPETLATPAPTIPDGANASQSDMDSADTAYLAWGLEAQRNLQCRRAEFQHLTALSDAREAEHNRLAQRLAEVSATWEAERTEYCARPRKQCETTDEE